MDVQQAWSNVEWEAIKVDLEQACGVVGDHVDRAGKARKQLADATREFKKGHGASLPHESSAAVGDLLKLYQAEIDLLTKRAKWGEAKIVEVMAVFQDTRAFVVVVVVVVAQAALAAARTDARPMQPTRPPSSNKPAAPKAR